MKRDMMGAWSGERGDGVGCGKGDGECGKQRM